MDRQSDNLGSLLETCLLQNQETNPGQTAFRFRPGEQEVIKNLAAGDRGGQEPDSLGVVNSVLNHTSGNLRFIFLGSLEATNINSDNHKGISHLVP